MLDNSTSNSFWASNLPPSESISPLAAAASRRRFLLAKYRHGKFRRFHPFFGQQEELNRVRAATAGGAGAPGAA